MAAFSEGAAALRARVEAAVLAEVERVGPAAFNRSGIVRQFLREGAKRTTMFRWIDQILATGSPDQHLAQVVRMAAAKRIAPAGDPGRYMTREGRTKLPAGVNVEHIATAGVLPVIERLNPGITAADHL